MKTQLVLICSFILSPLFASDCDKGLSKFLNIKAANSSYANSSINKNYPIKYKQTFVYESSFLNSYGERLKTEVRTSLVRRKYKESAGTTITPNPSRLHLSFGSGSAYSWNGEASSNLKTLIESLRFNLDISFNIDMGTRISYGEEVPVVQSFVEGRASLLSPSEKDVLDFPIVHNLNRQRAFLGWGGGHIGDSFANPKDFSITLNLVDVLPKEKIHELIRHFKANIPSKHTNKEFLLDDSSEALGYSSFDMLNKQDVNYDFEDLLSDINIEDAQINISQEQVDENVSNAMSMIFPDQRDATLVHAWVNISIPTKDPNLVGRINFSIRTSNQDRSK